jgi:predicted transcriptional regulator
MSSKSFEPTTVAERSKTYVYGRSPAKIVGSIAIEGMGVVSCQVEVSTTS